MSLSLEKARRWLHGGEGFRLRFLLSMMLVVAAITAAAVVIAQRHAAASAREALDRSFQYQTTALLDSRAARLAATAEKCRPLARSVRIRAALKEEDVEDLYHNAHDELRRVLRVSDDPAPGNEPRANFYGFVKADGTVVAPPRPVVDDAVGAAGLEAFARQFARTDPARRSLDQQESGYLTIPLPGARPGDENAAALEEVIVIPIDDIDDLAGNAHSGALVIGFLAEIRPAPAADDGSSGAGPSEPAPPVGLWLGRGIYGLATPEARADAALPRQLAAAVAREPGGGDFSMDINGEPHLLIYRALRLGACFPPAYGVCLYPLAASQGEQAALRWQIIGWGAGAMFVGFALSFLLSGRLSAPVERLAAGASANLAGRQRAEAELLETNARLEAALVELKATQAHVIQQERLRALGEMASGIAHDFNNALMPILGFSELLLSVPKVLEDRDKTVSYLQTINRGAKDAGNVVRRLREFYRAREEGEEFLPVELTQLIGQIADLTKPKWKDQALSRGATVRLETHADAGGAGGILIMGNESDLREALTNLIFNAVDAMPGGGTLRLTARREDGEGVLEVGDTGFGMDEEIRRRCLEPFFSTKGEGGTGLGLSMVFGIIQRHRGTVEIDSAPGAGSTFRLRLPLRAATAKAGAGAADPVHNGAARKLRVLAVEDEPAVRDILVEMLESEQHRVVTAATAREALEHFHENGSFDLVITDMAMPGMSGEQLAGTLKSLAPRLPVVLLTGFGAFMDPAHKTPNVDVVASKPITLAALRQSITAALHPEAAGR